MEIAMDVSVFVSDVSCSTLDDVDVLRLHDRNGGQVDVFLPYGSAECLCKLVQQALENEKETDFESAEIEADVSM